MAQAGQLNTLQIIKILDFGAYLDGGNLGEILLPTKWTPPNSQIGDLIEVFLYYDSSDKIIATTMKPFIALNEFGLLKVIDINNVGAFLDWGLQKDLLVPYREQKVKMEIGKRYLVYVYLDQQTNRIAASAKLGQFLNLTPAAYLVGDEVNLIIWGKTDIGYKAIINNQHEGLLYKNEVFQSLQAGKTIKGFINRIRDDGKIDLVLQRPGYEKIDELSKTILDILISRGGFLQVSDKSHATDIYHLFKMSKKNFKKSLGTLYKQHLISFEDDGIKINT